MIRRMPGLLVPALYKGMRPAMLLAERSAKGKYLSGEALQRRTGRLRNSIVTKADIEGDRVHGSIGTNVVYGRIWELGYSGTVSVRAHARTIRQAFGHPIRPTVVQVRAHQRTLNLQPRPFLRPAVMDNLERMKSVLARSIVEAFG